MNDLTCAKQILVVEREALLAAELRDRLRRAGHRVLGIADNGPEAIALAAQLRPDLVVMDIRLKESDGVEAGERIHRELDIPIVFVTSHSDQATLLRAASTSAQFGYVLKPFREEDLLVAIDVAMHRHEVDQSQRLTRLSEKQRIQAALRDSEELFRTAFEKASVGVALISIEGNFLRVNDALCEMLGYAAGELTSRSLEEITHEDDRLSGGGLVARALGGEAGHPGVEKRYLHKDGSIVWAHVSSTLVEQVAGQGRVFVSYITNISERRRADEALRASERQFANAFEGAPIGIALVAPNGRWLKVNRSLCQITGYSRAELLGLTFQDITHPDDIAVDLEFVRRTLAEEIATYQLEKRYIHKSGEVVWVHLSVSLVKDDAGAPLHFIAQIQDVTERRQMEEQLRQAQKLEAIGKLAGGIAHDFNNMLFVILASTDSALQNESLDPETREDIAEAQLAGERAAQLTKQLLAFSRRQILQPAVVDLAHVVLGMEKMLRSLLGDDVEMQLPEPGDSGKVFADPSQITQIVMNLAVNARDAMPRGGRVSIDVANTQVEGGHGGDLRGAPPGAYVVLSVSDTGAGMDQATQLRIFEPFFTTKERGKGTGLGLSTVFGIVRQSGGYITVESGVGRGTTFRIYLPRTNRVAADTPTIPIPHTLEGTETILLVDDDERVRNITSAILRRSGYRVLVAQSAGDALLLSEQHGTKIHLLLSDVVMPRMSGPVLVERLTAARPAMRVLLFSGYADDPTFKEGALTTPRPFLQKPFMPGELLRKVREVLDAP
jgi:PAS domain S-box-containing protein